MPKTVTHNSRLKQLLASLKQQTDTAGTVQDLLGIVDRAVQFNAPLQYRNQLQYSVAATLALAAILLLLLQHQRYLQILPSGWIGFALLIVTATGFIIFALHRNNSISRLSDDIFTKNVLFDNQLKPLPAKETASQLTSAFLEFKRGNHSRKIEQLYQGYSEHEHSRFNYYFYHFHYVNKRTVTYTESNGRGGTRTRKKTVYDHYHRYGICVPQFKHAAVMVYNQAPDKILNVRYRPASNRFNKHYRVQAADEMQAARIMKPAVVVAFEDLYPLLQRPNIEIQPDAGLCLSFNDSNLLQAKRQYSLLQPQQFRQEIAEHTPLDKLQQALHFIHHLSNHSAIALQETRL
ncbi:hypothetical protein QE250_12095 [Chromatiaceae bacterium AAb-1]|nr:hypothetical protein [Chromatiaceae bacterium AAb-1]